MSTPRRRTTDSFLHRWGPSLAFVTLAVALAIALQQGAQNDANKLRQGLVESCKRTNVLRRESNHRIDSHITERDVVLQLIISAKQIVRVSDEGDVRRGLGEFDRLSDKLEQVRFDKLDLIDCEAVIPRP